MFAAQTAAWQQFAYDAAAEKKFLTAASLFKKGMYGQSDSLFAKLIEQKQIHQRTTAAYIMRAKATFHLGEYNRSLSILNEFLQSFEETEYRDDAYYTLGLNQFMLHRYKAAIGEFIRVLDESEDNALYNRAKNLIESTSKDHLTAVELENLIPLAKKQGSRDYVSLLTAEQYFYSGDITLSKRYLEPFLNRNEPGPFAQRIAALAEKLSERRRQTVGVLLPLMSADPSSPVKKLAEDMRRGIEIALNEWNANQPNGMKITLDVRDNGRDSVIAKEIIREFAGDPNVVAVIGPLFSSIASACAPIANAGGLPMISPTASGNNIAAAGSYIFQANPDFETRAKAAARYAVQELGYRQLAVMADQSESGENISHSFIQEAERLGASVLAATYYNSDSSDLREQCMQLRRAGSGNDPVFSFSGRVSRYDLNRMIRAGADAQLLDSLRKRKGSISVTELFGHNGRRIADSLRLKTTAPSVVAEDLDVPLSGIQALFVPITDPELIGIISSQIKYFNIQTQLIGTGEWYDLSELEEHKRVANGVMFISDYYVDEQDSLQKQFIKSYSNRSGTESAKYTLFGYDTMKLLLAQMADQQVTRSELAMRLSRSQQYKGLHSYISFDRGRVNSYLHLLQYINGKVQKAGEIFVN